MIKLYLSKIRFNAAETDYSTYGMGLYELSMFMKKWRNVLDIKQDSDEDGMDAWLEFENEEDAVMFKLEFL